MGYSGGIFISPAEIPLELLAYLLVMPRILLAYARISLEYSRNSFFYKRSIIPERILEFLIWANSCYLYRNCAYAVARTQYIVLV